jgi:hypothetical protein
MIDVGKNKVFAVCKMFDNVQFFAHLHSKLEKSANTALTKIMKNSMGIKKLIFLLILNSLMPALKNAPKTLEGKKL